MLNRHILQALFALLRSGLWDKPLDDPSCFPLNKEEWEELFDIAVSQTIEGVVYDGLEKLPHDLLPPRELFFRWVVRLDRIEQSNLILDSCISEQVLFFNSLEVSPSMLKGQAIATYYPNPKHRICGDIDWYFDCNQDNNRVKEKLQSMNIEITDSTDSSFSYRWKMCEIEHHTKLFDVFNPFARIYLNKLIRNQDNAFVNKTDYYTLSPSLNILQVNLHILKHLLSFGIGLRQFCDSAILYAQLDGKYDKNMIYNTYKNIGVLRWSYLLHDVLVKYLGLDANKLPFALKGVSSSWLIDDIISTGNFGFYDKKYSVRNEGNIVVRKNKSGKIWYSFKRYFYYAPYEAISFPIVHFLERFKSIFFG